MTKKDQSAREASIKHLRKMLKPGATVYTILKHRSRSGMMRVIDVVVQRRGGALRRSNAVQEGGARQKGTNHKH